MGRSAFQTAARDEGIVPPSHIKPFRPRIPLRIAAPRWNLSILREAAFLLARLDRPSLAFGSSFKKLKSIGTIVWSAFGSYLILRTMLFATRTALETPTGREFRGRWGSGSEKVLSIKLNIQSTARSAFIATPSSRHSPGVDQS